VAALKQACARLNITFACPHVFVLPQEEGVQIAALPLAPPRRRFAVFLSGGLLEAAGSAELGALLAREVALLQMLHVRVPELWLVLRGLQPKPKARPGRSSARRRARRAGGLAATTLRQFVELCRVHRGLRLLAAQLDQLPQEARGPVQDVSSQILLPRVLGDAADMIAMYDEQGSWPAAKASTRVVMDLEERVQFRRLRRISQRWDEVHPLSSAEAFSPSQAGSTLRRIYRIGPERVERVLGAMAVMRRPWRLFHKASSSATPWPSVHAVLVGATAAQRFAELAADRLAAEVVGDHRPVVAGLVRLHGTPTDLRRLERGELLGIIDDAQCEHLARRRWAVWWTSAVGASPQPPLQLRIAELANWAASEDGRRRLRASSSWPSRWTSWLRSWFR